MNTTERLKASQELNEQYGSSTMNEVLSIVSRLTSPLNPGADGKGRAFYATGARKCDTGYLVSDHLLLVLTSICTMPINTLQLVTGHSDLRDLVIVCRDLTAGGNNLVKKVVSDFVIKTIADTFLKEVLFQDGFQPTYSTEALKTQIAVTLLSGDTSDRVAAIERAKKVASISADKLLDIVIPKDLPEKAESSENHLKIFHAYCTIIAITGSIDIVVGSNKASVERDNNHEDSDKSIKRFFQELDPRKDAGTLSREVMQRIEALEQQVVDMQQELDALKPAK